MDYLFAAESLPFTLATLFVVVIGLVELTAVMVGFNVSGLLDQLVPENIDGAADTWLGWLHVGKVPILVLLVILLTTFAIIGFTLNAIMHGVFGIYPFPILSSTVAFIGALPVVRVTGAAIGRILPKDESSAVSLDTLIGHVAVVLSGTAKAGYPAEARIKSEHGQTFYVRVEPESDNVEFGAGESVLLVKQISGSRFMAIINPRPDIL